MQRAGAGPGGPHRAVAACRPCARTWPRRPGGAATRRRAHCAEVRGGGEMHVRAYECKRSSSSGASVWNLMRDEHLSMAETCSMCARACAVPCLGCCGFLDQPKPSALHRPPLQHPCKSVLLQLSAPSLHGNCRHRTHAAQLPTPTQPVGRGSTLPSLTCGRYAQRLATPGPGRRRA